VGDGLFVQTPVFSFQFPEPNRYNPKLKPHVTPTKQRSAPPSNRYKSRPNEGRDPEATYREGSAVCFHRPSEGTAVLRPTLSESFHPLRSIKRLNVLTSPYRLLYICKVLEETGSPRAASNTWYSRGAGLVGAGFGHGFKDSSYISVQISLLGITAEVSQLGRFVLGKPFVCAAQPREGVTE
jgi:hypothetical protein